MVVEELRTASSGTAVATPREDAITGLIGLWMVAGLYVDGWADHSLSRNSGVGIVFYAGFVAMAAWFFLLAYRNVTANRPVRRAVPRGYRAGVVGLGAFVIGGTLDTWWHGAYGVEVGLAVFLSPTHLVLFAGVGLMVTSAFRSAAARRTVTPEIFSGFLGPLLSLTSATALAAFVVAFSVGFNPDLLAVAPIDGTGIEIAFMIVSVLVTSVVLVIPLVMLLRRWAVPVGALAFLYAVYAALSASLSGFEAPWIMVAPIGAGLVAELLVRLTDAGPSRLASVHLVAGAVPLVAWGLFMALVARFAELAWDGGLWGGTVLLAGAVGALTSVVTAPRR